MDEWTGMRMVHMGREERERCVWGGGDGQQAVVCRNGDWTCRDHTSL